MKSRRFAIACLLALALSLMASLSWSGEITTAGAPQVVQIQRRGINAAKDRRAASAYAARNANVSEWLQDTPSPTPGNAALLYYQAFLFCPETDEAMDRKLTGVIRGAQPDQQIRIYLGHSLPAIQAARAASLASYCDWQLWENYESDIGRIPLVHNVGRLLSILTVDARTLAADGHYRAALDQCLTIRRLAAHLSAEPRMLTTARNPDLGALRTIEYVLNVMPSDRSTLSWLRGQLAVVPGIRACLSVSSQQAIDDFLRRVETVPGYLVDFRRALAEAFVDEEAREYAQKHSDDELRSHIRQGTLRLLGRVLAIADSPMSYEEKYTRVEQLVDGLATGDTSDRLTRYALGFSLDNPASSYNLLLARQAHSNAVKAAVEIYLVAAETGTVPDALPEHLPRNPFNGQDFDYEVTDKGFTLRWTNEDLFEGRPQDQVLEFTVQQ